MKNSIDGSWTLFLDRDGVINQRIFGGYVTKAEDFVLLENLPQAIKRFNDLFSRVLVVTNQQCIGKGLASERNIMDVHDYLSEQLSKEGAKIDAYYFAPELSSDVNNTRKPKPDMGLKAKSDFPEIDFNKSVMVGDTDTDIQFGQGLGMKTVRIKTEEKIKVEADLTFSSLWEFSNYLIEE